MDEDESPETPRTLTEPELSFAGGGEEIPMW
jgi:hypothetical protein